MKVVSAYSPFAIECTGELLNFIKVTCPVHATEKPNTKNLKQNVLCNCSRKETVLVIFIKVTLSYSYGK